MAKAATVIVFARAPELGRVKRRLAAGIGAGAALRFHVQTLRAVVRRLSSRFDVVIAVTPDRYAMRGRWWPRGVPRTGQGPGDLGQRMRRALERHPGVLIGSDIPDVTRAHIAAALREVRQGKLVFGPATDGGFWLIGARDIARHHGLFRDVRWSSPHALADTLGNLAPGRAVALAARLADVDVTPS